MIVYIGVNMLKLIVSLYVVNIQNINMLDKLTI
jgi:hypothetical protein